MRSRGRITGRSVSRGPDAAPDDAKGGEDGNREEHPGRAADLSAGDDAEDDDGRMELDAAPHDERARDVVLDAAPDQHEGHEKPGVSVTAEQGDAHDDHAGRERADDGKELERPPDRGQ